MTKRQQEGGASTRGAASLPGEPGSGEPGELRSGQPDVSHATRLLKCSVKSPLFLLDNHVSISLVVSCFGFKALITLATTFLELY